MSAEATSSHAGPSARSDRRSVRVLVYSDDRNTRDKVKFGIGKRPARDLPPVEFVECATYQAVLTTMDAGGVDVVILDGEAVPTGGMGLSRQLKDEIFRCPPILLLTGRTQDAWLATWSRADAAVPYPLDPMALCRATVELARKRLATQPAH
jgi:DNA-binding response OmpR family regulator